MRQMIDTLPKLCGYEKGWCKVTDKSWFECTKYSKTCRYFSRVHLGYPIICKDEEGQLAIIKRTVYDDRFSTITAYDEAEPGIIKVDDTGYCDFCKLPTKFWDTNISVYICSNKCRVSEYAKLEKDSK
jgi:hypothetical protein